MELLELESNYLLTLPDFKKCMVERAIYISQCVHWVLNNRCKMNVVFISGYVGKKINFIKSLLPDAFILC